RLLAGPLLDLSPLGFVHDAPWLPVGAMIERQNGEGAEAQALGKMPWATGTSTVEQGAISRAAQLVPDEGLLGRLKGLLVVGLIGLRGLIGSPAVVDVVVIPDHHTGNARHHLNHGFMNGFLDGDPALQVLLRV